jgi:hypothetical protein
MASYEIVEKIRGKVLSTDWKAWPSLRVRCSADFHREEDPKSVSIGEICGLIQRSSSLRPRGRSSAATRGFDVKRQLKLLVPGSAPGEESEKLPEIAHMFNRTPPARFASAAAR